MRRLVIRSFSFILVTDDIIDVLFYDDYSLIYHNI